MDNIIDLINNSKNIVIISHKNMDGDAIGSSIGLMLALKKIGKSVKIYLEENIPERFNLWDNIEDIQYFDGNIDMCDLLIVVDVGDKKLLGNRAVLLDKIENVIAIDHHVLHVKYEKYSYVDPDAAAAGEIIYKLIKKMNIDIDLEIAKCLYVAIATDTGGFRFSNTTKSTHEIIGDLVEIGVDVPKISNKIFDETSLERMRLMATAIQTVELFDSGKIAVMTITQDMIKKMNAKNEDTEGIIDFAKNICNVEIAVLLKEKSDGTVRASLRSKEYANVSLIAQKFGGGGHKMAAGCSFNGSMEKFKEEILKYCKEVL